MQKRTRRYRILFWGLHNDNNVSLDNLCIGGKNAMKFCKYDCEYSVDQSETSLQKSDAVVMNGREE
jgi:hypothetical protein